LFYIFFVFFASQLGCDCGIVKSHQHPVTSSNQNQHYRIYRWHLLNCRRHAS
jgi:hypothetical protein